MDAIKEQASHMQDYLAQQVSTIYSCNCCLNSIPLHVSALVHSCASYYLFGTAYCPSPQGSHNITPPEVISDSVIQFSKLLVCLQIAEENKMRHGVPGMAVKTPRGNFTPHHEQPQQQQSEEPSPLEIDGKWTSRMVAVLSGKPQDLMTIPPRQPAAPSCSGILPSTPTCYTDYATDIKVHDTVISRSLKHQRWML